MIAIVIKKRTLWLTCFFECEINSYCTYNYFSPTTPGYKITFDYYFQETFNKWTICEESSSFSNLRMDSAISLILWLFLLAFPAIYIFRLMSWKKKISYHIEKLPGPYNYPIIGTVYEILGIPREGKLSSANKQRVQIKNVNWLKRYFTELFEFFMERSRTFGRLFRTWNAFIPEVHLSKPEHMEVSRNFVVIIYLIIHFIDNQNY